MVRQLSLILALIVTISASASALQKRDLLGSYRDWDALVSTDDRGRKTCYMLSTPKQKWASRQGASRGDIYVTVTHRPAFGVVGEVNVVVGYPLRAGSEVRLSVDGRHNFRLFTEGSGAWAYDSRDDANMATRMKAGVNMVVRGTSGRGTDTRDTYSLSGFTAAYNAITRACN